MSQTQSPAVVMTPGLENDRLGGKVDPTISHQIGRIKGGEIVTYEGVILGFICVGRDGRADAITRGGFALGRFNSPQAAARALLMREA